MKKIFITSLTCWVLLTGCSESEQAASQAEPSAPKVETVASTPKPAEPAHPGQAIWEGTCKVCHSVGLAGAPIIGNKDAWAPRIARGKDSLYQHALEGWGDMPARGGNPDLADDQVKLAVDYMVSKAL
ncbi:MAG: c-type cytochrome [Oceanobacter sp.]